jgi:vesicle coat complex subunit
VRAIGRCAVNLDVAAERCINVLVDLIKGRVSYVVQEAVVVVRDIFRKYPNKCAPVPPVGLLMALPAGALWCCANHPGHGGRGNVPRCTMPAAYG